MDVDGAPGVVGIGGRSPLGDMVHDPVHGHEEDEDLSPFGEICPRGIHLKLDVVGDVHAENWVGRKVVWVLDGKNGGVLWAIDRHDRQRFREITKIERIGEGSWWGSGHCVALLQGCCGI